MNPDEVVRLRVFRENSIKVQWCVLKTCFQIIKENEKMAEYILSLGFSQKELQEVKAKLWVVKRKIAALRTTTSATEGEVPVHAVHRRNIAQT